MTVPAVISGQGKAKGKSEYSSMTLKEVHILVIRGEWLLEINIQPLKWLS